MDTRLLLTSFISTMIESTAMPLHKPFRQSQCVAVMRKHSPRAVPQHTLVCAGWLCTENSCDKRKQTLQEHSAASHMRTSNEHTAPTSACNTATDTLYGVLQTPQLHVVLGELRENYKRYLSPLFPLTVIRSFHVPEVLFTLPRFHRAPCWAM